MHFYYPTLNYFKNSSGIDKISTKLLKDIMLQILDPILYLFNLSLTTGFIPDNYKYAKVIPIYKLKTYKIEETTTFIFIISECRRNLY